MLPTKFQVNLPFSSGEEAKINFKDGCHLRLRIRTILAVFIYESPRYFLPSFKSIGFLVLEKKRKIYFEEGDYGGHLGFPIATISASLDLHVVPIFFIRFKVNWPIGS